MNRDPFLVLVRCGGIARHLFILDQRLTAVFGCAHGYPSLISYLTYTSRADIHVVIILISFRSSFADVSSLPNGAHHVDFLLTKSRAVDLSAVAVYFDGYGKIIPATEPSNVITEVQAKSLISGYRFQLERWRSGRRRHTVPVRWVLCHLD